MDWLDPPYHFFHPRPEVPFQLPVVRFEVGFAQRSVVDPPYSVIKPTIRFHLPTPVPPDVFLFATTSGSPESPAVSPTDLLQRPYLDFTNQVLIRAVHLLYERLRDELGVPPLPDTGVDAAAERARLRQLSEQQLAGLAVRMDQVAATGPLPLTLRLTRHGRRIDTIYDVELVE